MEYVKAIKENTYQIYNLVQDTIKTVYPKYYLRELVDFFSTLHTREKISEEITKGNVNVLKIDNQIIGTGSFIDNHIARVFVAPDFQGIGYGSYIMQSLENAIALKYNKAILEASLAACCMYEKRGYKTVKHEKMAVESGSILVYEIMEKELTSVHTEMKLTVNIL